MTSAGWGIALAILLLGLLGFAFILGAVWVAGQTASLVDELKAEAERVVSLGDQHPFHREHR